MRNRRSRGVLLFWRLANPFARAFTAVAPWWVVLETTGCKTGRVRRVPLATGPRDGRSMWLLAVHGQQTAWLRNVEANPSVRLRRSLRWQAGTASVHPMTPELLARFNGYARSAERVFGMDPLAVRVDLA